MTSTHTPGPWVVHDHPTDPYQYGHHVTTADGLTVCSVTYQLPVSTPHGVEEATRVANARLIASAPEMLQALQMAESVYRNNCVNHGEPSSVLDAMQEVISKATGGARGMSEANTVPVSEDWIAAILQLLAEAANRLPNDEHELREVILDSLRQVVDTKAQSAEVGA